MRKGLRVVVISGPDGSSDRDLTDPIRVIRVGVPYRASMGFWSRIYSFIRYVLAAWWTTIWIRPRLIYASSTPLTVGLVALCTLRPFIFEVRDLWPQAPIELKALQNPILISLAHWLAKVSYRNAQAVVVLSPPMANVIRPHNKRVVIVPNFAMPYSRIQLEQAIKDRNQSVYDRIRQGHDKPYLLFYGGAIGPANGIPKLLEICRQLSNTPDCRWQLVLAPESGRTLSSDLQEAIKIGKILLLDYLDQAALQAYLRTVNAMLVSFDDYPSLQTTSPNKLFLGLSVGLPMVMACQGWHTDMVVASGAGYWFQPSNFVAEGGPSVNQNLAPYLKTIENPTCNATNSQAAWELSQSFSTEKAQLTISNLILDILGKC